MALDSSRTINGSFGKVFHDGRWLTNIQSAEINVEVNKEEIHRSGTRWTAHKVVGLTGSGTISGYKVTSEFARLIGQIADDSKGAFVTELIFKLDDPEAHGHERIRIKNVTFDNIPLMSFEVNSISEEELNFTFSEYEFLDAVTV